MEGSNGQGRVKTKKNIYDYSGQELYKYVVGGMIEIKGIEEITLTYSLTGWSIYLFCHLCYKHDFLDNGIKFK